MDTQLYTILLIIIAMLIITWVFWMVKSGLINPDNFRKDDKKDEKVVDIRKIE